MTRCFQQTFGFLSRMKPDLIPLSDVIELLDKVTDFALAFSHLTFVVESFSFGAKRKKKLSSWKITLP